MYIYTHICILFIGAKAHAIALSLQESPAESADREGAVSAEFAALG